MFVRNHQGRDLQHALILSLIFGPDFSSDYSEICWWCRHNTIYTPQFCTEHEVQKDSFFISKFLALMLLRNIRKWNTVVVSLLWPEYLTVFSYLFIDDTFLQKTLAAYKCLPGLHTVLQKQCNSGVSLMDMLMYLPRFDPNIPQAPFAITLLLDKHFLVINICNLIVKNG